MSSRCLWSLKHTSRTDVPWPAVPTYKSCVSARDDSLCVGVLVSHTPCLRKNNSQCGTAETCTLLRPSVAVKREVKKKKAVSFSAGGALDQRVTRAAVVASFKCGGTWQHLPQKS